MKIIRFFALFPIITFAQQGQPVSELLKLKFPEQVQRGKNQNGDCRVRISHDKNIIDHKIAPTAFQLTIYDMDQTCISYMLNDTYIVGGRGDFPNVIANTENNIFVMNQPNLGASSPKRANFGGFQVLDMGKLKIFRVYSKNYSILSECQIQVTD